MWGDKMSLKFKGTLCDDHLHMTAHEYAEHKRREYHERQKTLLRKMANNPILDIEYKEALRDAAWMYDLVNWWSDRYFELKEKVKNGQV